MEVLQGGNSDFCPSGGVLGAGPSSAVKKFGRAKKLLVLLRNTILDNVFDIKVMKHMSESYVSIFKDILIVFFSC